MSLSVTSSSLQSYLLMLQNGQAAGSTSTSSASALTGITDLSSAQSTGSATGVGTDVADVSDAAQLFNKLQQLSESDPTEFKQITGEIAGKLQSAAAQSSNPAEAQGLTELAKQFSNASESGNFSDLLNNGSSDAGSLSSSGAVSGHHHHHHHHSSGDSSASSSSGNTVSDIISEALQQLQQDKSGVSTSSGSDSK